MSNFEKITVTPEVLGEFLASLTVANGPWDEEFHRTFCDFCERENCDEGRCPNQDKRYNPLWWLKLGEKPGEALGLTIKIKAAFPVLWNREYYTVAEKKKETRAPCVCCDNTGKVTIKGVEYPCPRCKGNWREKEVVGETTVYSVAKWVLERIDVNQYGIPDVDGPWWLATPWRTPREKFGGAAIALYVSTNGYWGSSNCSGAGYAIRPALLFSSSLLVSIEEEEAADEGRMFSQLQWKDRLTKLKVRFQNSGRGNPVRWDVPGVMKGVYRFASLSLNPSAKAKMMKANTFISLVPSFLFNLFVFFCRFIASSGF